jgi:hypothetical protein
MPATVISKSASTNVPSTSGGRVAKHALIDRGRRVRATASFAVTAASGAVSRVGWLLANAAVVPPLPLRSRGLPS